LILIYCCHRHIISIPSLKAERLSLSQRCEAAICNLSQYCISIPTLYTALFSVQNSALYLFITQCSSPISMSPFRVSLVLGCGSTLNRNYAKAESHHIQSDGLLASLRVEEPRAPTRHNPRAANTPTPTPPNNLTPLYIS